MKKFILAPDSFKGTLSAAEVCEIQAAVIRKYMPDAQIHSIPMLHFQVHSRHSPHFSRGFLIRNRRNRETSAKVAPSGQRYRQKKRSISMVLKLCGNDVLLALTGPDGGGAHQRLVVRLASAGSEGDLPQCGVQVPGENHPGLRQLLRGQLPRRVQTGGIPVIFLQAGQHGGIQDADSSGEDGL